MRQVVLAAVAAVAGLASAASGQILNDGNMNGLSVGTNPDVGSPAGAWGFPANYVTGLSAELIASQFSIVPTSLFQPGVTGNSLRLNASLQATENIHLPNLFTGPINQAPGQIVAVQFDLWVPSAPAAPSGGGAVYVGGDHGGGGFNNALDRGPQIQWLADGSLVFSNNLGVNTPVMASPYPRDAWQTIRMEIDLNADNYDLFFGSGGPLTQVGTDLPFRSTALTFLDRFTFVSFGGTTPVTESYLDNVTVEVIPAPGTAVLGGLMLLCAARRRR